MRRNRLIILFAAMLLFCVYEAKAQQGVPAPVKASLVSDVSAVVPGKTFKLGVLFEIAPHWHIYWKNPGATGLPTRVEFTLPGGFRAEELRWPEHKVFKSVGDGVDYGYENSVLLYSVVRAPEDLQAVSVVEIGARASWVSCKEICIPGSAQLELELPVADKAERVNSTLFMH